jgi:hypothetical protein
VVGDGGHGLRREIVIVDAKMGVKPVDLVGYELTGDEALLMKNARSAKAKKKYRRQR